MWGGVLRLVLKVGGFDKVLPSCYFVGEMPFKDPEQRKRYMKEYLAEFRAGKRRRKPDASPRVEKARANRERWRKVAWELEHAEERVRRRREQRKEARADAVRGLLRGLGRVVRGAGRTAKESKNQATQKAAA